MSRITRHRHLAATALASALLVTGGAASAKTTDFIDVSAGGGFSTNPGLRIDSRSSAFGRISAYGLHSWDSERSSTAIHGYIENTSYLSGHFGSQQIFTVGANSSFTASPTLTVYGNLNFSGDFNSQLSNRLFTVPSQPPVPEPGNPLPPITNVPDVFGFTGHHYRLNGQVGASIRSSELSTISLSAGASRSWFTGSNSAANYNTYFGSVGYTRQISERTSGGVTVYLQHQDFKHGDWANIVNPTLTAHTQLSETITADAAVGVLAIQQNSGGQKDTTVSPSFSGNICSQGTISSLCGYVSHDARSALSERAGAGTGRAAITTTVGLNYYRQLSADGTLQAGLSGVRYSASDINGQNLRSTYMSGLVGYDRKVGHRLAAGITGGARKLFQTGPDPDVDFNLNLYLRYRIGDIR